jgi:DNA-3-methyladenine glycosylase
MRRHWPAKAAASGGRRARFALGFANENGIPSEMERLPRAFYDRETALVAQDLLGKHLVHVVDGLERVGRIVEVEAYLGPHDRASHSSKGLTPRTRTMFGPPGHAYVYLIYGMHWCLNVVTEREGHGAAVLLRAVEPIRGLSGRTQGPGLLSKAFGISRSQNGEDLLGDALYLTEPPETVPMEIVRRPRIGVDYAGAWARRLLRFYIRDNPYVSRR